MDTRTAIWDARLDAKIFAAYYGRKTTRYQHMERAHSVAAALVGSGSIVMWLKANASPVVPGLALAAILISLSPFTACLAKWVVEADIARAHWARRVLVWDMLWLEVAADPAAVTSERFQEERARDEQFHEPNSPPSRRLAAKCQEAVHRSLGLELQGTP